MQCVFPSVVHRWQKAVCCTAGVVVVGGIGYGGYVGVKWALTDVGFIDIDDNYVPDSRDEVRIEYNRYDWTPQKKSVFRHSRLWGWLSNVEKWLDVNNPPEVMELGATFGLLTALSSGCSFLSFVIIKEILMDARQFKTVIGNTSECCAIIRKSARFTTVSLLKLGCAAMCIGIIAGCVHIGIEEYQSYKAKNESD